MSISSTLNNWYLEKKRDLPWRTTTDPYKIWISEVILQQTRVAQGLHHYLLFIQRFPDIHSLASADIEEVLKTWQGLGYYSRARHIHEAANYIEKNLNGKFPSDYKGLLGIKGIGEYTASAIGSIAFDLPVAVVDGNVCRFISRFYGIHEAVNSTSGLKKIRKISAGILDTKNPAMHNQSIMEFGALHCTKQKPLCQSCPFACDCYAFNHDMVKLLPVKIKSAPARNRFFNYYVFLYLDYIFINKRTDNDIWKGLYDFPLHETSHHNKEFEAGFLNNYQLSDADYQILNISDIYVHQLSHQKIHAKFFAIKIMKEANFQEKTLMVGKKDLHLFPVPKLIEKYLCTSGLENYFTQNT